MNIYHLSQDINNDYDTYDSMVVYAESEEDARNLSIECFGPRPPFPYTSWVGENDRDHIKVSYIGSYPAIKNREVIISSFNAG